MDAFGDGIGPAAEVIEGGLMIEGVCLFGRKASFTCNDGVDVDGFERKHCCGGLCHIYVSCRSMVKRRPCPVVGGIVRLEYIVNDCEEMVGGDLRRWKSREQEKREVVWRRG